MTWWITTGSFMSFPRKTKLLLSISLDGYRRFDSRTMFLLYTSVYVLVRARRSRVDPPVMEMSYVRLASILTLLFVRRIEWLHVWFTYLFFIIFSFLISWCCWNNNWTSCEQFILPEVEVRKLKRVPHYKLIDLLEGTLPFRIFFSWRVA